MVAIIDYGMGNIASVQKALKLLGIESCITSDHKLIKNSSHILLPGVGSFRQGMDNLRERGLDVLLREEVIDNNKPFLGVCLGMQLIFEKGTEPYINDGLGWIKGTVEKFETGDLRIPHMGWNNISIKKKECFPEETGKDYYFIHSYHVVPDDKKVIAATVQYGFEVVASVKMNNIFATQFHPEKSQQAGLNLLKHYFSLNA
jgi:glutamine amidotransferase